MKLRIPAVLAAIAIALTGCGGGSQPSASTSTPTKAAAAAPSRAAVPDVVGKTLQATKDELRQVKYSARVMGPDGVKWAASTEYDETVLTVSTMPQAGGVSANDVVDVKVNLTEKEALAAAKAKAAAKEIADAEAAIAKRYTYTCAGTPGPKYENYRDVWVSSSYKDAAAACTVKIMGIIPSNQSDLLPSEQKLLDAVASAGAEIKDRGATLGRIMSLCAKLDNTWGATYADKPTTPESKAEAATALNVCPDAPHAAALQEGATVSKITDGTKVVGQTMEAGTWKTKPGVKLCYWSRNSGGGDIIANDIIDFAPDGVTVTVYPGEGFKSDRCGTWSKIG